MSSRSATRQLMNSRARIHHLGGHSWVSGWLYDLAMPTAWLSCDSPLAEGEHISLIVQSELMTVHLKAQVDVVDREETHNRRTPYFLERGISIPNPNHYYYRIKITSPIRPSANPQADRKAVAAFPARIAAEEDTYSVLIADMSRGGARVLSPEPIAGGEVFELTCEVDGKLVRLPAIRSFLRQEPAKEPLYSVGLRFEHVSRIDAARWKTRLSEAYVVPARAVRNPSPGEMDPRSQDSGGADLRVIANKLLAKLREVNRAERRYLRQQLMLHEGGLSPEDIAAMEAQLDVMARHKEQFADNLSSTIQVMHSKIEAAEAA